MTNYPNAWEMAFDEMVNSAFLSVSFAYTYSGFSSIVDLLSNEEYESYDMETRTVGYYDN